MMELQRPASHISYSCVASYMYVDRIGGAHIYLNFNSARQSRCWTEFFWICRYDEQLFFLEQWAKDDTLYDLYKNFNGLKML